VAGGKVAFHPDHIVEHLIGFIENFNNSG